MARPAVSCGPALCRRSARPISIELNRLDEQGPSCRASFVIANPGARGVTSFKLDLVVFDKRRHDHPGASPPMSRRCAPDKTSVKVFDIPETSCGAIGSILVNDVLDCRDGEKAVSDCVGRIAVTSKLPVKLLK